jgi:hypothetical protein
MPRRRSEPDPALAAEAERVILALRQTVAAGQRHWFYALLEAIRLWPLPEERVAGRQFRYLVGGEAFDWLLLAERLLGELDGLVPEDEAEALLFHGQIPLDLDDEQLRPLLGAKYRAHLNFVYGVRVEQALQLAVLRDVRKERLSRVWENGHIDDEVFSRLYGLGRLALLEEFRKEKKLEPGGEFSLSDLDEFTYWLFRRRVNNHDPARVASDTRKGLAMFQELEALRRRGRGPRGGPAARQQAEGARHAR